MIGRHTTKYSLITIFILLFLQNASVFSQDTYPEITSFEGNKAGLTSLIATISTMNYRARLKYTRQMRPTKEEYSEVFVHSDFADKIFKYHKKLYHSNAFVIQPNLEGQSEILLWEVSQEDLKKYINDAVYFPGGYKEIAEEFNPDLLYYRFKYVQPGKHTGSAYDLIVYVSGKWRFFPRPWAAVLQK